MKPSLGIKIQSAEGGAQLQVVFNDGTAGKAGLSAGDVVVAVEGLRVNGTTLEKVIASRRPGEVLDVHAFRRDELMQFRVTVGQAPLDTCVLQLPDDSEACHRVDGWILGH